MPTLTIYPGGTGGESAGTLDGYVGSSDNDAYDYNKLDTSTNYVDTPVTNTSEAWLGQFGDYGLEFFVIYQIFSKFDTSSLTSAASISSATFSAAMHNDASTTDFNCNVKGYNWGTTYTTTDFRTSAQLAGYTTLCYKSTSGWSTNTRTDFTSQNWISYINKTGTTYFIIASSRQGTEPGGNEAIELYMSEYSSTTYDPRLIVNYTTSTTWYGTAALTGAGLLNADGIRTADGTADLIGTGSISSNANTDRYPSVTIEDNYATLSASVFKESSPSCLMIGTGSLWCHSPQEYFHSAALLGEGRLEVYNDYKVASASLSGGSSMIAEAYRERFVSGDISGSGSLTCDAIAADWATITDIDGFIVYVHRSATEQASYDFNAPEEEREIENETKYYTTPAAREFTLTGVPADEYYTMGVQAYRVVDQDISPVGPITSSIGQSAFSTAYQPETDADFQGTIDGISAEDILAAGGGVTANPTTKQITTIDASSGLVIKTQQFGGSVYSGVVVNTSGFFGATDLTNQTTIDNTWTFKISATNGAAAFKGDLSGATGTFGGSTNKVYVGGGTYPLLYGTSSGDTSKFYVDNSGNAYFKGSLNGATITGATGTFSGAVQVGTGSGTITINSSGISVASGKFSLSGTTGNATFNGELTSTSGTIGGFNIGSTSISAISGTVGMSTGSYTFWAGSGTPASAEFRVTSAGAVTATNATINGTITSTIGNIGGFTIGQSSLTNGSSTVGMSTGTTSFWAGGSSGSAPFRVTSAGALIGSSFSLGTSSITISSSTGLTIDNPLAGLPTSTQYRLNFTKSTSARGYIGTYNSDIVLYATYDALHLLGYNGVIVDVTSGGIELGTSGNHPSVSTYDDLTVGTHIHVRSGYATIYSGSSAPSGGNNGDIYLQTGSPGGLYHKTGGSWTAL